MSTLPGRRRSQVRPWMVALLITVGSALYQRLSGPTYPVKATIRVEDAPYSFSLARTHAGEGDAVIRIPADRPDLSADLAWRRHKTADAWTRVPFERAGAELVSRIPHQPPAGKVEYRVGLNYPGGRVLLKAGQPVVLRFRGDVPAWILLPHVVFMFGAMLLSTRAAVEAWSATPDYRRYTLWTVILLTAGGMVLGPIVQKFAFGEFWTGWPWGTDLTDNKTAIAWIAWLAAAAAVYRAKRPGPWVVAAAAVTLVIFAIPHSMFGSEIDYSKGP